MGATGRGHVSLMDLRSCVRALILLIVLLLPREAAAVTPLTREEQEVKRLLWDDLRQEDEAILRGDEARLRTVYALPIGADALRHALARRDFLRAWQVARGVHIDEVLVELRTPGIRFNRDGRIRVFAIVSEEFRYHHMDGPERPGRFGLGTRRWYLLERAGAKLQIRSEDYTDPLDQDTRIPGEALPSLVETHRVAALGGAPKQGTSAAQAVHYADAYCGAAPGCGNDRRYNPRYGDFNGEGGDCTNFISQTLRSAGFRKTDDWAWDARKHDGTRAWSNAQALVDYLEASGRGTVFASGTYSALVRSTPRFPSGALGAVREGDVIGYFERGRIVHLALVVGRDPSGYVLVNSHTSDRFHVPWDIGWDRTTYFHLIRVHYPKAPTSSQGRGVRSQIPLADTFASSPPIRRMPPFTETAAPYPMGRGSDPSRVSPVRGAYQYRDDTS